MDRTIRTLLATHIVDPATGWSIGVHGAIAEFQRAPKEASAEPAGGLGAVTPRGALRVDDRPGVTARAYEWPSRNPRRWVQGVLLCLPGERRVAGHEGVIAELGPDRRAPRPEDQEAVLFDLGVALPHVRACVRSADEELIGVLRHARGRSVLDPSTGAMAAILEAQPHRVFCSDLARIEVYQPIPRERGRGFVHEGPHTHLLPDLLAAARCHGTPEVVPSGTVPALEIHPPSPLLDSMGRETPFEEGRFTAFQEVMRAWGDPAFLAEKAAVENAIAKGLGPDCLPGPADAGARAARKVALRQIAEREGASALVAAWRAAFDLPAGSAGP